VQRGDSVAVWANKIFRNHIPRWPKVVEDFTKVTGGVVDRNSLRRKAIEELSAKEDHPLEILHET
jgi:hypothetical protein